MAYISKVTAGGSTYNVGSNLYGTCDTAAGTAAKVAVVSGFDTLETGVTVHINFINSFSYTGTLPTLAIKSSSSATTTTPAKTIWLHDNSSIVEPINWDAGTLLSLTYNGSHWIINSDNDTKNTAGSTDTSSKIFLIGATSQAANPQTYSQDTAYVGTDGCLYSGGTKVLTSHQDISGKLNKSGGEITGTVYSQTSGANFEVYNPASTHKMRFTATDTPRSGLYDMIASKWAFWKNQDGEYQIGPNGYAVQARTQAKGTTKYPLRDGVVFAYRTGASSNTITVACVSQWDGDGVIYQHHVSSINVAVDIWHETIKVTNNYTGNIQVIMIGQFNDNSTY